MIQRLSFHKVVEIAQVAGRGSSFDVRSKNESVPPPMRLSGAERWRGYPGGRTVILIEIRDM